MKKITLRTLFFLLSISSFQLHAQTLNPTLFHCMQWRCIGPHRGGRTVGASGNAQTPNVFFIGVNDGGVWKTTDYGRTWQPVFDDQPTGSIGDVAVAPSNPTTVYVASGEGIERPDLSVGNGMYKSIDAGKTWVHIGLENCRQISSIAVDPQDEQRVFVGALGHPYGPNTERGVYRTTDAGKTWEKVLYFDENTGAIQVAIDPNNSKIIYADMFTTRLAPWENGIWEVGANTGLYKSIDGGKTWKKLTNGLPGVAEGLGRIGFCIAPSNSKKLYAVVSSQKEGGFYVSDDAGETWGKLDSDPRLWDRGDDFAELKVDPKNENIVYDANVVCWKSFNGGRTWNGYRGAPGGDDSHRFWINPVNPDIILLAGDQGAIITVNGGTTWSSWYNQPTAQFYHVSADNAFPYNVYSGQQESGSVGIASRGNDGEITFREWHPVAAQEYGYVVADPLDPNIVYGGKLSKYNKLTGQSQEISPDATGGKYRYIRTAPIVFSPIDNKTMFYAGNVVFKTRDGGNSWQVISPDLTRASYDVPACVGIFRTDSMKNMPRRGVIYTIALSPIDSNTIWAGTDDGYIQVTRDGGKNWTNVTPPEVTSWCKISLMDASHTDVNTAYAAVNEIRLDDERPHIFCTHDGGKTWKEIVNGLPDDPINVVKEDPVRKGMLFAGSERMVHVSFDEGEHWQPLRLNMPCTSIRDLVIKDNDLIVATHGRSFWILDDITPLRQIKTGSDNLKIILYKPADAYRVRWDMNSDTPLPQEEPAGLNPPDGAIIDYYLKEKIEGEITLDITDSKGALIRHYSNKDTLYDDSKVNIPLYWVRAQPILSPYPGAHRFEWDMHYQPLNVPVSYPISAIYGNTAPDYTSPWVMPGTYTATLTANGKTYPETFKVIMDPRVKETTATLQQQFDLSLACYNDRLKALAALKQIHSMEAQVKMLEPKSKEELSKMLTELAGQLASVDNTAHGKDEHSFTDVDGELANVHGILQGTEMQPTTQCIAGAKAAHADLMQATQKWRFIKAHLTELNIQLRNDGLPEVRVE